MMPFRLDVTASQYLESKENSSAFTTFTELERSTLLLWIVFFGNAFSYYGRVLLTSELSTQNSQCNPTSLHSGNSPTTNDNLYIDVHITSFVGKLK